MSQELASLLSTSHKRLVATVMRHIERDVYPQLTVEARKELRDVVVRAARVYHDTAMACLQAVSVNETNVDDAR